MAAARCSQLPIGPSVCAIWVPRGVGRNAGPPNDARPSRRGYPLSARRRRRRATRLRFVLTAFGVASLVFMMAMYALERRGPLFTLGFTAGCALASSYGFLSGAWPFGAVEAVWSVVALSRFRSRRRGPDPG